MIFTLLEFPADGDHAPLYYREYAQDTFEDLDEFLEVFYIVLQSSLLTRLHQQMHPTHAALIMPEPYNIDV